jgi:membrane fusion protein (multidrug efflux system)
MTMSETSPATESAPRPPPLAPARAAKRKSWRKLVAIIVIVALLIASIPYVVYELHTVSTDDAYVNGHVTFVAPRVGGQVMYVFVDDNNRVHKGDLLVQLDKEPYQVALNIAEAAVSAAQADLTAAQAQARASEGQIRSLRFNLDHAIESVDDQIAQLRSAVATLQSKKATLAKTQADYDRAVPLLKSGAVAQEDFDRRTEARLVAEAEVEEALQHVYELRVSLGLPAKPTTGDDLAQVPDDLDQTFSTVRQAQASLMQGAAQLGYNESFNVTPKQMYANFYKQDPEGNIDKIYTELLKKVPAIKQAQAKLAETQRDLDQARLNLRYTDVFAEIDGVITRRDVNPGNNVIAGQSLMAIRSLTDIWVDANFKETQLASLRIGQPADLDVDMYGGKQTFKGRISGFTMGTGSTLALLPAENATGNFVKVVQRLPVRIDLVDYDPDKMPLFIGLSVTPHVHINEEPTGANAGEYLQPYLISTTQPSAPGATTQP